VMMLLLLLGRQCRAHACVCAFCTFCLCLLFVPMLLYIRGGGGSSCFGSVAAAPALVDTGAVGFASRPPSTTIP